MSETIPRWGYRLVDGGVDAKLFELAKGESIPKGWVDSPAKCVAPKAKPKKAVKNARR